jgi:hypothetical protein
MVVAQNVYRDISGKHIIAGTFTNYRARLAPPPESASEQSPKGFPAGRGPGQVGSPYLYLALVEVYGEVRLSLKYVELSEGNVVFEADLVVKANSPAEVAEYIIPLPYLAVGPGAYSLDLLHEFEVLGSWRINLTEENHDGTPKEPNE